MMRLFLLLVIIFLLVVFIWQLKNYLTREDKEDELRETRLEGNLIDIDKEIAEEKARQKAVSSEIKNIDSPDQTNKEEIKHE